MAVEESVLTGTKKKLGLDAAYEAFDHDVITEINTAFFTLFQLGIGPVNGLVVTGVDQKWSDFSGPEISAPALNAVQTYVYLCCRLVFDPPGTPHHITAMKEQKTELEYRLKHDRELRNARPGPLAPETIP